MPLPHLPGTISPGQVGRSAEYIASQQSPTGLIPWFVGHHADPWDHVEAAMALTVAGRIDEARAAFAWSRTRQGGDGSWPMRTVITPDGTEVVTESSVDTNQCSYLATGVWHHALITGDETWLATMWPAVERAVDLTVGAQLDTGGVAWARDRAGEWATSALLTGSSCVVLSLRCALAIAERLDLVRPDWELALGRLAHAVAAHDNIFEDKSRYSMDWYYPVLGGAVRGAAARQRLDERWSEFVVPGHGIRCVADRPWATGAESCELAMALDVVGARERALAVVADIQAHRDDDGGYWTGYVWPDQAIWPEEKSTWTAAAVILATDALSRTSPANGIFRGETLPPVVDLSADCGLCAAARTR